MVQTYEPAVRPLSKRKNLMCDPPESVVSLKNCPGILKQKTLYLIK